MFERRSKVTAYPREQTIHWLTWLARSLMCNNRSEFFVEWMQPDWLPSPAQRWIVAMVPVMFSVLVGVLLGGLSGVLGFRLGYSFYGLAVGPVSGPVIGLIFGLAGGVTGELDRITPVEAVRWSWRREGLLCGLIIGLLCGLLGGVTTEQIAIRTIPNEGIRRSLRNAVTNF